MQIIHSNEDPVNEDHRHDHFLENNGDNYDDDPRHDHFLEDNSNNYDDDPRHDCFLEDKGINSDNDNDNDDDDDDNNKCCAVCSSNKFLLEHYNKFQLELECSKCIPMKLTNEIQIQYHTNKFHWSISFEETILEHSNSVPMFQLHNTGLS